jgi:NAD(P)-dependent dehydrogenase (short-subunit alcohol dehydrogenase family)
MVPRLKSKLEDRKTVRKVTATMALPQLGRPDDVANAAAFLASDALARHVTGQTLELAGGMEGRALWSPGELNPDIA